MISNANINFTSILQQGTMVAMIASYDCNLNYDLSECIPTYNFERLDDSRPTSLSKGFNYRYANYYRVWDNSTNKYSQARDLVKVFGARFIFLVSGVGRKAGLIPTMLNLASGLALLSLATITTDFVASYLFPQKRREGFLEAKYADYAFDSDEDSPVQPSLPPYKVAPGI
eukprot:gnl/Hemi2/19437_TR6453_c0_g1_i1.p2 gnl/Hemi2/19437_TR6453_c0_g1~~gnl/Hemi2/19437_TR6453_c0_g1_i1.p2  ORF type:complete len:171 (-),score=65.55 gnl/Hemi2/19437_TR6453_c0_g1_i1:191-703(-)